MAHSNNYLSHPISIEDERISTELGFKGRADAVVSAPDRKTILELKTGRIPVRDHMTQLLRLLAPLSDEDDSRDLTGRLYYSQTGRALRLELGDLYNADRGSEHSGVTEKTVCLSGGSLTFDRRQCVMRQERAMLFTIRVQTLFRRS